MTSLWAADGGDGLQIWRVTVTINMMLDVG